MERAVTLCSIFFNGRTFCDVQVKEVTIQYGLDYTCYDGDQIKESFKVETVDPVDKVESTVGTQGK